jgi:hypothetical protein
MAPIPTPEVLWRKPPVLALAALPEDGTGRVGESLTRPTRPRSRPTSTGRTWRASTPASELRGTPGAHRAVSLSLLRIVPLCNIPYVVSLCGVAAAGEKGRLRHVEGCRAKRSKRANAEGGKAHRKHDGHLPDGPRSATRVLVCGGMAIPATPQWFVEPQPTWDEGSHTQLRPRTDERQLPLANRRTVSAYPIRQWTLAAIAHTASPRRSR